MRDVGDSPVSYIVDLLWIMILYITISSTGYTTLYCLRNLSSGRVHTSQMNVHDRSSYTRVRRRV